MMAEPTEIRGSSGEAVVVSCQGDSQSFGGIDGLISGDRVDRFNSYESHGDSGCDAVGPGRAGAELGVVNGFDAGASVLVEKRVLDLEHGEQVAGNVEGGMPAKCSEKCALRIQETDGAVPINAPPLGEGKGNGGDDFNETREKRQENEGQKGKRQRRRGGGKARKNNDILICYAHEKNEKGLQYSIKEMEGLRYEKLDYQKKKWIEVFSGLSSLVAQEYEGLVRGKKKHHKPDDVPSFDFDFDPRPQFLKSTNQVEQIGDNSGSMDGLAVEDLCSQDGEYDDDDGDDTDEDYSSIQKPAFVVTGDPDFDSGPPLDGLEYLRRVRWEADRIPIVKVAKIDTIKEQSVYMPQIPDIMTCPENLLPLKEWEDSFLADFSELRLRLSENAITESQSFHEQDFLAKMLESANAEATDVLTSTDDSGSGMAVEASDEVNSNSSSSDLPTLSKILKMEPAARTTMLRRRISSVEKMSTVSWDNGLWLFALCAAVDCPLDADTSAALRSLLRKCAGLRAVRTEPDDELIVLNILVTISGRYFGQLEK